MNHSEQACSIDAEAYRFLDPIACIDAMFEHTDSEGRLLVPDWLLNDDDDGEETTNWLECEMTWDDEDRKNVIAGYERLFASLKAIAAVSDRIGVTREENEGVLSDELLDVWDTYIRRFNLGDIDYDTVMDIRERMNSADFVADFANMFEDLASENEEDLFWLGEEEPAVTAEEEALYYEYLDAVFADAESRLDRAVGAYDVISHAMRLIYFMTLNAPDIILKVEARSLAQAMAINACAGSIELVSDAE